MDAPGNEITTVAELEAVVGLPMQRAADKALAALGSVHREWIARSPFCMLATSAADGTCDVSPKGDPMGFAKVLDDHTLAIPERPGNRRVDGYRNIVSNPHVGLIFLVPGRTDTLRINGRARLLRDAPWFDDMVVKGHRPLLGIEVTVEETFFHCAKAFMRSGLWQHDTWDTDALPTRAQIVKAVERTDDSLADIERHYGPTYAATLYRP